MKKFLWTNDTIKKAIGKCTLYGICQGNAISIDTRTLKKGDIFVAFKGENVDGHDYVAEAFKKGATCAIVERSLPHIEGGIVVVKDVRDAIQRLAAFNRKRSKAKFIAVTGSVGKTSTKEALALACTSLGKTYCSRGNYNNELGLPISLASQPLDVKCAVFELGMSAKGEIAQLTKQVKPDLAIITTIAGAHLEQLGSLKAIAEAKAEIFLGMSKSGIAILNGDGDHYGLLAKLAHKQGLKKVYSFGTSENCEGQLINYDGQSGGIEANIFEERISYNIEARGKHQALNSIAALVSVVALGGKLKKTARALNKFSSGQGRGALVTLNLDGKKVFVIDDSYNANPTSMRASLDTFKDMNARRKIAVLGDMRELGTQAIRFHVELVPMVEESGVHKLITIGTLMKNLFDAVAAERKLAHFDDYSSARDQILSLIEDEDCILFKASNGTKVYEIVRYLTEKAS